MRFEELSNDGGVIALGFLTSIGLAGFLYLPQPISPPRYSPQPNPARLQSAHLGGRQGSSFLGAAAGHMGVQILLVVMSPRQGYPAKCRYGVDR